MSDIKKKSLIQNETRWKIDKVDITNICILQHETSTSINAYVAKFVNLCFNNDLNLDQTPLSKQQSI